MCIAFHTFPFFLFFLTFPCLFYFCKTNSNKNRLRRQKLGPSTQTVLVPKPPSWNISCASSSWFSTSHLRIICIYDDYGMGVLWPIEYPSEVTWLQFMRVFAIFGQRNAHSNECFHTYDCLVHLMIAAKKGPWNHFQSSGHLNLQLSRLMMGFPVPVAVIKMTGP